MILQLHFECHCWLTKFLEDTCSHVLRSTRLIHSVLMASKQNKGTEVSSKLKSPKTRQVQEILFSTLEHLQVLMWDRTRCPEEKASSVCMPHPLQMFYGNLTQLGKKSNSVIRSRSLKGQNWCNVSSVEGVTVYGYPPECRVRFGKGNLILFGKIPVPTIELP